VHKSVVAVVHAADWQERMGNETVGVTFTPPKFEPLIVIDAWPLTGAFETATTVTTGASYENSRICVPMICEIVSASE
jgi:hypothetical protein